MNDQQIESKADQVAGKVKEGVGNLTGDTQTKAEGQNQQTEGKVRQGAGDVKDKARQATDRVGDAKDRVGDALSGKDKDR
ncbi:MAG: CsbD family protein [Chloroflexota bacterium]